MLKRVRHLVCAVLCFAVLPAAAMAEETCGGKDMLAELDASEPDAAKAIAERAAKLENTEALLWKIEKDGKPASYLTGTMHITDPRITTLSPKLMEALGQVKTVALEVADLSDAASMSAMTKAGELLVFTDGQSLENLLSQEEFEKVKTVLSASGMPGEFAGLVRPWLVSMLMAVSDCERAKVQNGGVVLDAKIGNEAKARNIPVTGLETIESQLKALASIPQDEQVGMLKMALKFSDRRDDMMETLVQMFVKRNMGAAMQFHLAKKAGIGENAFASFQKILLADRNRGMANGADELMHKGPAMIAVGALHLPGKEGLVSLLREKGYSVTPID